MKKLYTVILSALLLALLCVPAFANTADSMMRDAKDAVSTAIDEGKDLVTDLKDMVDPDGDGEPEAEGDGVVDDDKTTSKDTTNERPSTESSRDTTDRVTDRDTTDRETTDRADETTGVIEGMELEEKGINPWAIVIAVIVVIAVLVLIFILIPKRR